MKAYIYKITNTVNGMLYIGQTKTTVKRRWDYHINDKKGSCKVLSAAIKKYGPDKFIIETIEEVETETKQEMAIKINAIEKAYIASYNTQVPNGYNIQEGGSCAWTAPEHRKKGPPRKWTEETRIKYRQTKTGMKYKEKESEDYVANAERNAKTHFKPIKCNETGQIWNSVKECAEFFGVKPKQISRVLKGQRKHLRWEYSFSYLPKNNP